ncbi:hypothetical protein [Nocardia abscessus]|uniref:hypothetical protein n=1 Tax=Nocardia abscessus TaxID=120957 RepID=UPI002453A23A|nr:hypothetical protein [Nocardia abscessus]
MTDAEFERIETQHGFEFADDHRAFLAAGMPVRDVGEDPPGTSRAWERPWPDWRHGDPEDLRRHLDWPIDDVVGLVEQEQLWLSTWGERPTDPADAVDSVRRFLRGVPTLVPIYAHRFLPAGRGTYGHPVLSVWRLWDMICYGADLNDWARLEFTDRGEGDDWPSEQWKSRATVPFWRDYLL